MKQRGGARFFFEQKGYTKFFFFEKNKFEEHGYSEYCGVRGIENQKGIGE
jgi:hypothetical protein